MPWCERYHWRSEAFRDTPCLECDRERKRDEPIACSSEHCSSRASRRSSASTSHRTARLRRVSCQRKSCRAACQGGEIHFRPEGEAMPSEEELRRAMAARAERKELEEARVAHDTQVRDTWIQ